MNEQEFLKLKNRYYTWKAMQPQSSRLAVEQVALRWGYETAQRDVRERAADLLFGKAKS